MHGIDFLAVENQDSSSTKSGDAIVAALNIPGQDRLAIVVIDGGYIGTGQEIVDHIATHYNTDYVDIVINTHPDRDHINGLLTVLEQCRVGELMMHLPWTYRPDAAQHLSNYENVVGLYDLAVAKGVRVTEPFTGESRLDGALTIMGPTMPRYIELLNEAINEELTGVAGSRRDAAAFGSVLLTKTRNLLERAVAALPFETLTDTDDTGPRNQMSAITLLNMDGERHLLTGDAGIASLDAAADYYEATIGSFEAFPLEFFQAPHHGSKHNLGPTILNRILGNAGAPHGGSAAYISSALASEKHPSPKVVNALIRRGAKVYATEGNGIFHHHGLSRAGWGPVSPLPPLDETD